LLFVKYLDLEESRRVMKIDGAMYADRILHLLEKKYKDRRQKLWGKQLLLTLEYSLKLQENGNF